MLKRDNSLFLGKYIIFFISTILFLNFTIPTAGQSVNGKKVLTIQEVIQLTLSNNKFIKLAEGGIGISKGEMIVSGSEFNLKLYSNIDKERNAFPTTIDQRDGILGNQMSYSESDLFKYGIGIAKKLKFGTIVSSQINFINYGKDTLYNYLYNNGFGELITNRSSVSLNVTQPLLKGFGKKYNYTNYETNEIKYKISETEYLYTVERSIMESIITYLEYIAAQNNLQIKTNIDDKYQLILKQIEKLIEMDAIPASDMNYLKADYSIKKTDLFSAQNTILNKKIELSQKLGIINHIGINEYKMPTYFFITDIEIADIAKEAYLQYCFEQSLKLRSDYKSEILFTEIKNKLVGFYKNSLKPQVDLNFSAGYNGIYESGAFDQYYKPYYMNIPGINYKVGLIFTINPKNDYNKGNLLIAKSNLEKQMIQKEILEQEVFLQISVTYNDIINYKNQVASFEETVEFYKIALDKEKTKLNLGTSTVINLVQIQNDYYQSLELLNNAILNLNKSVILYRYYTGSLIDINEGNLIEMNYTNLFKLPFLNGQNK